MKWVIICLSFFLATCTCPKYDIVYEPPGIDLVFPYGSGAGEFEPKDSVFRLHISADSSDTGHIYIVTIHPFTPNNFYTVYNVPAQKVLIESLVSDYKDTIYDLKVKSRPKSIGRGRCKFQSSEFFDIECTYNGQSIIDHDHGSMQIQLRR
jgi:hypothetical protein